MYRKDCEPGNLLRATLDSLSVEAGASYPLWNVTQRHYLHAFRHDGPRRRHHGYRNVDLLWRGQSVPTSLDVGFPVRFRNGNIPPEAINDATV